jgi:hypothetical protein
MDSNNIAQPAQPARAAHPPTVAGAREHPNARGNRVNRRSIVRRSEKIHESAIRKSPHFQGIATHPDEPVIRDNGRLSGTSAGEAPGTDIGCYGERTSSRAQQPDIRCITLNISRSAGRALAAICPRRISGSDVIFCVPSRIGLPRIHFRPVRDLEPVSAVR